MLLSPLAVRVFCKGFVGDLPRYREYCVVWAQGNDHSHHETIEVVRTCWTSWSLLECCPARLDLSPSTQTQLPQV